ncbi:hypothetical protein BJF78_17770 [Pseudonocardia sp. CNS-139]|nr:hypothetical protein BJF78_17770 [Pseudonocardia sp. CNS-139]
MRPEPTLLTLTAYRPLALDVRFSCDAARQAEAGGRADGRPAGVVVATVLPESPEAAGPGMLVTAEAGAVRVEADGRVLLDEPLPPGPCEYRIEGRSAGRPTYVVGTPEPAGQFDPGVPIVRPPPEESRFAQPGDAELTVTRDGVAAGYAATRQLPDVDVLVTDARLLPAGGLAVRLRVDDELTSSPTPEKLALTWTAVGALALTVVLLLPADRGAPRERRTGRPGSPRAVDVVVPGVLLLWLFVAPATDDDGYFATQAANAALSGEIGNYFQLYDHSFVPFTWVYQGLSWWQLLVGTSPVAQRVPALVCGLLTWAVVRRLTAGTGAGWAGPAAVGTAFLAWWLPYDMGVRPEAVVALLAAAALLAVLTAARRCRLALAWLAFALAGAAVTAHTTGVVALAALVAGLPLLRPLVRDGGPLLTAARAVAVVSGGAVALVLGFADGGLRDVVRSQTLIESVLPQDGWAEELQRYGFLLDQIPMGSFARRAAVLACLVGLGWLAVLAAFAAARRVALPVPLWLTGAATGLAFAALAFTPSKWTHHFGALAGIGPAFLGMLLALAGPLVREVLDGRRPPPWLLAAAAGSVVLPLAVTWRGPNSWPYAWLDGLPTPFASPELAGIRLDSPLLWAAVLVVAGAGFAVAGRTLAAVPVVVAVSLALSVAHPVVSFTGAGVAGVPPGSLWAEGLAPREAAAPPTPCGCSTRSARGRCPRSARPARPSGSGPAATTWQRPAGRVRRADLGQPARRRPRRHRRHGHRLDAAAGAPDPRHRDRRGQPRRRQLPHRRLRAAVGHRGRTRAADRLGALPVLADVRAGPAAVGRGRAAGGGGRVHHRARLAGVRRARRRGPRAPVRPRAAGRAVAPAWQSAFAFPCQRPAAVVNGLTEPPAFAVLRADEPLGAMGDQAWQPERGGVFGQVPRSRSCSSSRPSVRWTRTCRSTCWAPTSPGTPTRSVPLAGSSPEARAAASKARALPAPPARAASPASPRRGSRRAAPACARARPRPSTGRTGTRATAPGRGAARRPSPRRRRVREPDDHGREHETPHDLDGHRPRWRSHRGRRAVGPRGHQPVAEHGVVGAADHEGHGRGDQHGKDVRHRPSPSPRRGPP